MWGDSDVLKHISKTLSQVNILASFDITNLYTHIPHNLCLETIKYWLEKHRRWADQRFKTTFINKATRIVLDRSFRFHKIYLHVKGMAIGKRCVPLYFYIVMSYLESRL